MNIFKKQSVKSILQHTLQDSESKLLEYQQSLDYNAAMIVYHQKQIARCRAQLGFDTPVTGDAILGDRVVTFQKTAKADLVLQPKGEN